MFISRLECHKCQYASDEFSEGVYIHDDSYSFVFQRSDTKAIIVKEIPASVLTERLIDVDAPDADQQIQANFADSNEHFLRLPLLDSGVSVDAVCPQCGALQLVKVVIGWQ